MDPRIFHLGEIDQHDSQAMGNIYEERRVGMRLEDFFRRTPKEMIVSPGVVIVGGRESIKEVCLDNGDFRFRGDRSNLAAVFMRSPSAVMKAAAKVGQLASAPFRAAASAIDRYRNDCAQGTRTGDLSFYVRCEAHDLAKLYANSKNLRLLANALNTRYTCVTIMDHNETNAPYIYAGQIAVAIRDGMAD